MLFCSNPKSIIWLVILISGFFYCHVTSDQTIDQRCTSKKTCSQCIGFNTMCSWCKQEMYGKNFDRCDIRENHIRRKCSLENIVSPKSSLKIEKNLPLSEAGVKTDSYIQLQPQEIRLKLRSHEKVSFPVVFRQAEDYPLDLYYLMDLTYSMSDDKVKLEELGDKLADSLSNLTHNFRMGFGSFVDKIVLPYVNTVPSKLINPCLDQKVCDPPYGFKNRMPLSNDSKRFVKEVAAAKVSANLDDAEGGFDAIMQVIVCKKKIDWNDKSRKIILFATDSGFHYAGDGKLGGIVLPNDEKCHLDEKGYYTMSTQQDYPSLSQINRQLRDNKVILIFAVTKGQLSVYQKLSNALQGAYTRKLAEDSSNIVELVRKQYSEISSEVELTFENVPQSLIISTVANCPKNKKGTTVCKGLKVGTTISFNVSIELESCPKNRSSWHHNFIIYPAGLNEVLRIHLEMLCGCDCENEKIENSPNCSFVGTRECGICNCYENYYGSECECNSTDLDSESHLDACRIDNTSLICSGNGECICGICYCTPRQNAAEIVSGSKCECRNYTCLRDEEERICGGIEHGICECDKCSCNKGWSGPTCSCSLSKQNCMGLNGKECSGNGRCECGKCVCFDHTDTLFRGPLCDDCPKCESKCNDFRPCVECRIWRMGEYQVDECSKNCNYNITVVSEFSERNRHCRFQDDEGCSFQFTYKFNAKNKAEIQVLEKKECAAPPNYVTISLGVVGGILLIGLIVLLIIRMCIYIKDSRDYARFLEEVEKTNWGSEQNPIYKAAISNYTNPTYGNNKGN